eukprot:1343912-Lingulodinium_polyedra.AAC.1
MCASFSRGVPLFDTNRRCGSLGQFEDVAGILRKPPKRVTCTSLTARFPEGSPRPAPQTVATISHKVAGCIVVYCR